MWFYFQGALNATTNFSVTNYILLTELLFFSFQAYHDPMLKLSIMTEQELNQIFGTLDSLIPLHEGKTQVVFACVTIAHRL